MENRRCNCWFSWYIILADTIAKNPPAFPSISLPKIETKPKSDSKEKDIWRIGTMLVLHQFGQLLSNL